MRRSLVFVISLMAALVVALPAQAKTVTIETSEYKFTPSAGTAAVGDTIVFKNSGTTIHNAKASDDSFKTDTINPGEEKSVKVTQAGDIAYVCTFHESLGMKAKLTVAAAGGSSSASGAGAPSGAETAGPSPSAAAVAGPSPSAPAGKPGAAGKPAAVAPPTERYFPKIALIMLIVLLPMIGLAYRKQMRTTKPTLPPPAPPAT